MKAEFIDKKTFLETIKNIDFKENDIKEAQEFGCKDIYECYENVAQRYSRYVLIKEKSKTLVPIILDRCGYLTFFVSKELDPRKALSFVKEIKRLANWYTNNYETTIFVKVANWYREANRIVKLVGFKPYIQSDEYTIYVYERIR